MRCKHPFKESISTACWPFFSPAPLSGHPTNAADFGPGRHYQVLAGIHALTDAIRWG
jgi:hypothetical protein